METESINLGNLQLEKYLSSEDIDFLNNIQVKKNNVENKKKQLEASEDKIVEKIIQSRTNNENGPKHARETVSNSELALQSTDAAYKNLETIQNYYRSIENSIIIIYEKCKMNNSYIGIAEEMITLQDLIKNTKTLENTIEKDNEKNYLIINGFMENNSDVAERHEKYTDLNKISIDQLQDNMVLRIKEKRVELPYTKKEVENYMKTYPEEYKTVKDVIVKEFMMHTSLFNKHPVLSRFKEAYYLCRNKEMMTIFESFSYAKNIMFKSELNPYIVAAAKSKKQLEDYIECLENNKLDEYKHFKIIYEINPMSKMKVSHV
ncbi:MAG: hypothetical protein IKP28_05380 [Clostridia bacterium]|nr:hypothetical protein [Clostridia bacterium]